MPTGVERRRRAAAALAALAALAVLAPERAASACAACACGDQTLTALGIEKPYRNRVRLGLEERMATLSVGDQRVGERSLVLRTALTASWVPHERLQLAVMLPWFDSFIHSASAGQQQLNGLGDLEASARVLVFRERHFAPRHLLWLSAGVKTPTGPRLRDSAGYPYSDDDQPGSGSWDPFGGVTYGWFGGLTSVFVSASYRHTTPGPRGFRFGPSVGGSVAVQLQPYEWGAIVLGADTRWAEADSLPNGAPSPSSGGAVLYASPSLLAAPTNNLLIRFGVQIPALSRLDGIQSEGTKVILSLAYDVR